MSNLTSTETRYVVRTDEKQDIRVGYYMPPSKHFEDEYGRTFRWATYFNGAEVFSDYESAQDVIKQHSDDYNLSIVPLEQARAEHKGNFEPDPSPHYVFNHFWLLSVDEFELHELDADGNMMLISRHHNPQPKEKLDPEVVAKKEICKNAGVPESMASRIHFATIE